MERQAHSVFIHEKEYYIVLPENDRLDCDDCAFGNSCDKIETQRIIGECTGRKDEYNVIFSKMFMCIPYEEW